MLQLRTPARFTSPRAGGVRSWKRGKIAPQFRPPPRATVPPNGSKTCTKQSFRSPTRSIHPRASRAASYGTLGVCEVTNKEKTSFAGYSTHPVLQQFRGGCTPRPFRTATLAGRSSPKTCD
eukprot:scaffold41730_cov76-Phaeocystis_antarctica.AAC.2